MRFKSKSESSPDDARCDLCGLEVKGAPYALEREGARLRFCCDGCLGIYCLLNGIDPDAAESASDSNGPG